MVALASSTIRAAINTTRILSVSKTAQPGECINVYGERFSESSQFQARDFDGEWANATTLERSADGRVVTVRLPSGLTAGKVYDVRCLDGAVYGDIKSVNEAEIWWCRERVTAGGLGYLYGRNLTACGTPTLTLGGEACTITSSNNYRLTFTAPALADGEHSFVFANDRGSQAPDCTATVWTEPNYSQSVYDVTAYGAVGDGVTDDTAAILAAISASPFFAHTIYFPAGNYLFTTRLELKTGGKLKGDGSGTTRLFCSDVGSSIGLFAVTPTASAPAVIEGINLDLSATTGKYGFWVGGGDGAGLSISSATINCGLSDFYLANVDHVHVENSAILAEEVETASGRQMFFSGSTITQTGAGVSTVFGNGMNAVSFDGCTFTQQGAGNLGRAITDQPRVAPFTKNIYIGGNTFSGYGPHDTALNTGETILFEPEYVFDAAFQEHTVSGVEADGAFLRRDGIASEISPWLYPHSNFTIPVGMRMHVRSGPGVGQVRTVTAANSQTNLFATDEPWEFAPTTSSKIEVSPSAYRVVIYDNAITHRADLVSAETHNASTGVSFFAGGIDCIIDGNTFTDVRTGISFAGRLSYKDVDVLNNNFSDLRIVYNFVTDNAQETEWSGVRICGETLGAAICDIALNDSSTARDGDVFAHNVIVDKMTLDGNLIVEMGPNAFRDGYNRAPIPVSWDDYDLGANGIELVLDALPSTPAMMRGTTRGDYITGSSWEDVIEGGAGDDVISAGARADQIIGGAGDDAIDVGGGDGAPDRIYYNSLSDGFDSVQNFLTTGSSDKVNIDALLTELGLTMAQRADYFAVVITGTETTLNYYAAGDAPSGTATPLMEFVGDYTGKTLDDFIAVT